MFPRWAGLDLNQRRQSQWIYSPPPLTTRTPTQTPLSGFEPETLRLTVVCATAAPKGITKKGVATPQIYLELTKLLILIASDSIYS